MDGHGGLSAQYPSFSHASSTSYLPEMAAFDYSGWFGHGHKPISQDFPLMEMITLRSKLAVAESRVDELQKEKAVAKNVIDYLLKRNAGAGNHTGPPCTPGPGGSPQFTHTTRVAQDVKDILDPVIGLLHQMVRAGSFERMPPAPSAPSQALGSGKLLDLLDEGPVSDDNVTGAKDSLQVNRMHWTCSEATKPTKVCLEKSETGCVGQADARENDLMFFEKDTSLIDPLVVRFRNGCGERESGQGSFVQPHSPPTVGLQEEGVESLPKSFDESDTGLSGSTHYDASRSGSASSSSPNSSVNGSDDENDQIPDSGIGNSKGPVRSQILPMASSIQSIFKADEMSGHERSSTDQGDTTTSPNMNAHKSRLANIFMPKWRVLPFTMAANERSTAIMLHQKFATEKEIPFPGFFKFGIRFRPNSTAGKVFRTVLVDNLPPEFAISTLLQHIKGGAVLDAKLLNTVAIHGRSSALITFVREEAAKAFEERARIRPFKFDGLQSRVVVLPTPTWPMPPALQAGVLEHGHTRCLQVSHFPTGINPTQLEQDLQRCHSLTSHQIEAKRLLAQGVLQLRFTSVKFAEIAWGIFSHQDHPRYRQCTCKHMPDPCAQPWDDLSDNPHPAMDLSVADDKQLDDVVPATQDVPAIKRFKEYPLEIFVENTNLAQAKIGITEISEDNTCRLSDADVDDTAAIQRGRGFSTKQPAPQAVNACNQQ
ncbi:MAG: hypothetical protein Q9169_003697 [Polycauliona sp. 2 TL-2023]